MHVHNSPWVIVVGLLEASKTYVPMLLAFVLSQSSTSGMLGFLLSVLFWGFSVFTGYSVVARWFGRAYLLDSEGVRYRQGVLARTEVYLPWKSVASIEVNRDPVRSVAGLVKIVVRASAETDGSVTFDAVPMRVTGDIECLSGLPVSGDPRPFPSREPAAGRSASSRVQVFRATPVDLLVMSLAYGRFALFVPFALGLYLETADIIGLPDPEWVVSRSLSGSPAAQVVWLLSLVALATVYGYGVTLLRFWGLRVSLEGSSLVLEGGLFHTRQRVVSLEGVSGLVLRRNIVELLTGRGRLALLTRDASQGLGKNVLLPALKMHEIEARLDLLGGGGARELLLLDSESVNAGRVAWIAAARVGFTAVAMTTVLAVSNSWHYYVAAIAAATALCIALVNACVTVLRLDPGGDCFLYRRGVIWRSTFRIPVGQVHVLRQESRPWDRLLGLRRMHLHFFAAGSRRLFAWQHSIGEGLR